jgi:hypothetical protein
MDSPHARPGRHASSSSSPSPGERHRNTLSAAAVTAVAVAALAAAWFSLRPDSAGPAHPGRPDRPLDTPVVHAPPIDQASNTSVLGAAPACRNCGMVEAVAVQDNHTRFQVLVRMDDGTTRKLEQAVPVLAGSRVIVQGGVARPANGSGSQAQE